MGDACGSVDSADVLLWCAAGNSPGPVAYPAKYSTVFSRIVAVGASDESDAPCLNSGSGPELTVVGPGTNILATTPTYILPAAPGVDRKSTRLNSSHQIISYAVFCLKKKTEQSRLHRTT